MIVVIVFMEFGSSYGLGDFGVVEADTPISAVRF